MFRILPPVLLILALFVACSRKDDETRRLTDGRKLPLTEYEDSTVLDMHDESRKAWRLVTTHLVRWPGAELVHATPVDLSMFDSTGAFLMRVTADSGAVDEAVNFLLARGRVFGRSVKGLELRTDSLRWNKSLNEVRTDAAVRVRTESGDILTGMGFVSDANLDHWQILSDVKGEFQQVEDRVEDPAAGNP